MSKLPNAPLIEVIFELSWIANTSKEHEKFQFLLGNMYNKRYIPQEIQSCSNAHCIAI